MSGPTDLRDNPLRTRADLQDAAVALFEPAARCVTSGRGRLLIGDAGARYTPRCAGVEGFVRQLWSLAPLLAGGGRLDRLPLVQEVLVNGTDPAHPEYWGDPIDYDIRFVEAGGLGAAIAVAPGPLFHDLPPAARDRVAAWLGAINTRPLWPNNWLFFRVLANAALRRVGRPHDEAQVGEDLARLEAMYRGDGWYNDGDWGDESSGGPASRIDWYTPWAMHYYGLLLSGLGLLPDDAAERARERAAAFAPALRAWFARDGQGLAFGRSLTYRFAQGAFWGGLAVAGVEALPWGQVKGLLLRNLRWWLRRPIFDGAGLMTAGYAYPNPRVVEQYSAGGSPCWALKAFLPLALGDDHPFWRADEEPLDEADGHLGTPQPAARLIAWRDPHDGQVSALLGQTRPNYFCHTAEKYAKFAYSTRFGFSVPAAAGTLDMGAHDSTLALSEDGAGWRVRCDGEGEMIGDDTLRIEWRPWADVRVVTWLVLTPPGYARVHRIETARPLRTADGGFAVERRDDPELGPVARHDAGPGVAAVVAEGASTSITDLLGGRPGQVVVAAPNTNLLHPRTDLPTLTADLPVGTHWLASYAPLTDRDADREPPVTATLDGDAVTLAAGGKRWRFGAS